MKFINSYIFVVHFCPPGSGSGLDPDPQQNGREFYLGWPKMVPEPTWVTITSSGSLLLLLLAAIRCGFASANRRLMLTAGRSRVEACTIVTPSLPDTDSTRTRNFASFTISSKRAESSAAEFLATGVGGRPARRQATAWAGRQVTKLVGMART
jgi:hypothetical protein